MSILATATALAVANSLPSGQRAFSICTLAIVNPAGVVVFDGAKLAAGDAEHLAAVQEMLGIVAGGGDALVANPLSQFANTTSAQLLGIMSDATGTGSLVFAISPALTGTPTAPTASPGTNNTQISTTAYADAAALAVQNGLLNGAGGAYDTLKELGDLLVADESTAAALATLVASKASTSSLDALIASLGTASTHPEGDFAVAANGLAPDTGYTTPVDVGQKGQVNTLPSTGSVSAPSVYYAPLYALDSNAATDLANLSSVVKAMVHSFLTNTRPAS